MQDIFDFLKAIAANNDRSWFATHRGDYENAHAKFSAIAADMIERIGRFDHTVCGLQVKDTLYRFYRDTRFSVDKSPFKRHFGTYINPKGKKSLHGGYYLHIEPGACMIAVGAYCLPSQVLKAVRWSIVGAADRFHAIMTEPQLAALKPKLGETYLKTVPAGFPRDFIYPEYLRPKEYDLSVNVPDSFFFEADYAERAADILCLMKPFLDFVNDTVDDYI